MADITRIIPRWIAPVIPRETVLENHALVIKGKKILDLLPAVEAEKRYPDSHPVRLENHLLIPGLVNSHGHAAMSLLRGYADDYDLMTWLTDHIWPAEAKLVEDAFVYSGARLSAAEMLSGGTTCAADSYFFPESTARAFLEVGLRSQITAPIIHFSNSWANNEQNHIDKTRAFINWSDQQELITAGFAPHAPYSVSNSGFAQILDYAADTNAPIHLHLHESAGEIQDHLSNHGCRPLARINELGLLSPRLQLVHMTQLTPEEVSLIAAEGVQIAHCPQSNMKLGSGICPITTLAAKGLNISVGTDGAASNNDLDMLQELRSAALLAKVSENNPCAVDAFTALEMGTINGARFLGLEQTIGSLEAGKSADLTAINFNDFSSQPVYHPISQLIYTATAQHVTHTWVNGKLLYDNQQFNYLDTKQVRADIQQWQRTIKALK
ncbi:MAG: TRZ/ATZ family hydrolase [Gammaproteobacteria bacterium]|jgi:5-methylthioadenosine/S-adenosylhomocysteine deaminase|nr:TRZ/ATZ family hydrolase [Gammaproteobacteria bacterium]MBT5203921.1 TRZ/ATZ family hydrolase [Gammaproteobacteria bacterium]MBT5602146.1 TRZ/ATZ family hydrolase [Gammaproteobacteria bacterium]MBT6243932.1 TRZ/ATZ family hydrolase [Gammaproteobacteria bacterium]